MDGDDLGVELLGEAGEEGEGEGEGEDAGDWLGGGLASDPANSKGVFSSPYLRPRSRPEIVKRRIPTIKVGLSQKGRNRCFFFSSSLFGRELRLKSEEELGVGSSLAPPD